MQLRIKSPEEVEKAQLGTYPMVHSQDGEKAVKPAKQSRVDFSEES